jgi:hypothetical protein
VHSKLRSLLRTAQAMRASLLAAGSADPAAPAKRPTHCIRRSHSARELPRRQQNCHTPHDNGDSTCQIHVTRTRVTRTLSVPARTTPLRRSRLISGRKAVQARCWVGQPPSLPSSSYWRWLSDNRNDTVSSTNPNEPTTTGAAIGTPPTPAPPANNMTNSTSQPASPSAKPAPAPADGPP